MSSHAANACVSDASAVFKSAGTSCTTPLEIFFCDIDNLLLVPYEPIPVSGGIVEDGGCPIELVQTGLEDEEIWR
jgi:hypothetical protein